MDILVYIPPMAVAYCSLKTASYSSEMSESLHLAEISPLHKMTFSGEFSSSPTIKSSLNPYIFIYTGCLKKSKSNGIANLLSIVVLIAFSWFVTVSAVPSAFFAPSRGFRSLAGYVCLEAVFLPFPFLLGKDPCMCHKHLYCQSCQCVLNQAWGPFFHQCLPTLFTTLRALSVDSMSRLSVILRVYGRITRSPEPCGIFMSACWPGYPMSGMLTMTKCSLLRLKANYVLCSTIGSNSP